jgi:hypothetical protein
MIAGSFIAVAMILLVKRIVEYADKKFEDANHLILEKKT